MASLSYLQPHIEAIHSRAERLDVPTPVVDTLRDALIGMLFWEYCLTMKFFLCIDLNTPNSSPHALRPIAIINALSAPMPGKQRSLLFASREHQDAQELFQLLSESLKNESRAVDEEASRDPGLGGLNRAASEEPDVVIEREKEAGKGVFDGLTANRRSCVECGYTEAVMHFAFDSWQLAVPHQASTSLKCVAHSLTRRQASCRLEDCLTDYTRLELLTDCICRKCSMLATHKRLIAEAEKATESEQGASTSKKKRAREARKLEARVKAALAEGRIEEDIKGVKMEKVFSRCSTKQAMIARVRIYCRVVGNKPDCQPQPPLVLALHLNRSIHYGMSGVKNTCRVVFPELLDLTPFTTSGQLSTLPSAPISTPATPPARSTTPTPATYAARVLYRLSAVVSHYGAHSFGHYVAYRRKPRPPWTGERRFAPPTLRCPLACECDKCAALGPIRDEESGRENDKGVGEMPAYAASRWLRISDDSVEEVGVERVLAENAGTFMLYYERVVQLRPTIWPVHSSPRSSEETIKPVGIKQEAAVSGVSAEVLAPSAGARIVRSIHARQSRSPSLRNLSPTLSASTSTLSPGDDRSEESTPMPMSETMPNGDAVHMDMVAEHGPPEISSIPHSEPAGTSRPVTPPALARIRLQHYQIASPQPAHARQPPSPSRTVDLCA